MKAIIKKLLFVGCLLLTSFSFAAVEFLWQGTLRLDRQIPESLEQLLEFRLYDVPTGGRPLWGRVMATRLSSNGEATVTLSDDQGSLTEDEGIEGATLEAVLATGKALYLGITVRGGSGECSPRQPLGVGSRALVAEAAGAAHPSKTFQVCGRLYAGTASFETLTVTNRDSQQTAVVKGDMTLQGDAMHPLYANNVVVGAFSGYGTAPVGAIVAIYTADGHPPKEVPEGWYLCDGQHGTPDLRDRFIRGAWSTTAGPRITGGLSEVVLEYKHLPNHTHTWCRHKRISTIGAFYDSINANGNAWGGLKSLTLTLKPFGSTAPEAHNNMPPYMALYWYMRVR